MNGNEENHLLVCLFLLFLLAALCLTSVQTKLNLAFRIIVHMTEVVMSRVMAGQHRQTSLLCVFGGVL